MTTIALPDLASRINAAHRECESAARSAVTHALEAGRTLLEAKQQVAHGQWADWLAANVECSERRLVGLLGLNRQRPGNGPLQWGSRQS